MTEELHPRESSPESELANQVGIALEAVAGQSLGSMQDLFVSTVQHGIHEREVAKLTDVGVDETTAWENVTTIDGDELPHAMDRGLAHMTHEGTLDAAGLHLGAD